MIKELPKGWEWKNLGDVVDILDSKRIPLKEDDREKRIFGKSVTELVPYYGATGQVGWIDDYLFDEELILLGEDGAPFFDPMKNKSYIISGKSWVNNHAHVLRAISNIALNQFVCSYLNIFNYHGYVSGTTRAKLNQSKMRKILIPLPPLETQRKIIAILEKANTLKKHRSQTDELMGQYLQSVFLELFGDPMKNPKGWEIKELETEIANIRYGTGSPPEYQERGIPFIRATNIKKGTIQKEGLVYISDYEAGKIPKCKVKTGNLILVRSGVNTGDCALVPQEYNETYAAYDLILEIPYPKNYYYNFLINSDYGKSIITPLTRRAGQPHLNSKQVKSLQFQLPPTQLLEKFAHLVEMVKITRNNLRESQKEIDTLFNALMQKAFTGELVA
jgi:type I restriction enzyme S subunit